MFGKNVFIVLLLAFFFLSGCDPQNEIVQKELLAGRTFYTYKYLRQNHFDEWIQSAVEPTLINHAVVSLPDIAFNTRPILEYLDITKSNPYPGHKDLTGWLVRQVSPIDGLSLVQSQIKLDTNWQRQGQKYENPNGSFPEVGYIDTPPKIANKVFEKNSFTPSSKQIELPFWRIILENNIPIIITEGSKKAGALLSAGYAAVTLPGVCLGISLQDGYGNLSNPSLRNSLKPLVKHKRKIYFAFDYDHTESVRTYVRTVLFYTAKLFQEEGSEVYVIELPSVSKVDDFIQINGRQAFDQLFLNAITFDAWSIKNTRLLPLEAIYNKKGCH